ncbi:MAG: carboxypeptidase-like regulatory domain-containing protein [Bacteroidota bacterium]
MKKYLLLFCCFFTTLLAAQRTITGTVTASDGEALIGANVLIKGTTIGTMTDYDGKYWLKIPRDSVTLVLTYTGYESKEVNVGTSDVVNLSLSEGVQLAEVVVISGRSRKSARKNKVSAASMSNVGGRKETKRRSQKGKPTKSAPLLIGKLAGASVKQKEVGLLGKIPAGQLTAGEWKDLNHWSFWSELMKNDRFRQMQSYWRYYPNHRFAVKLSDENGRAVANQKIVLLNQKEEIVWEARSDNRGSAELWGNFYGGADHDFQLRVMDEKGTVTKKAIPFSGGINSIQVNQTCNNSKIVEAVFAIDATGSMNDEIEYLQSEVGDVIRRVELESEIQLRCGALYYWGHNSPVLSTPLTEKHEKTIRFIQEKDNAGGGSEEFVEGGLKAAIDEMNWQEDAVARIVFLLLDEPPRYLESVLSELQKTIQKAARQGIKIIPVAASGTDKDTEFLLKFFAMATNGTYTFLTDHSGIGDAHIEPEAGDYNIETLNDLLIRLIGENATYYDCTSPSLANQVIPESKWTKKVKKRKQNKQLFAQVKCFPNPVEDYFFVELKQDMDLVLIVSSDAKVMLQYPELKAGQIRVHTANWPRGKYYVHFYQEGKHIAKKIALVGNR